MMKLDFCTLVARGLTPSESRVVSFLVLGCTNKEIGRKLAITEKTVKFHLTNVFKKLKVKNRCQLVRLFFESGLIKEDLKKTDKGLVEVLPKGFNDVRHENPDKGLV